ncbi:MAG: hypothetical protein ACPL3B_08325, partial [Fervidobacterium sp.]
MLGKYVNNNSRAEENCTYFNTSFTLNESNLLNYLSSNVEVSVFGVRSGKYVEAKSKIFVPDPNFKIKNITADYSDFPCVKLVFNYTSSLDSSNLSYRNISLRNFFVEDGGLREVEIFNRDRLLSGGPSTKCEVGQKCYRYNNVPVVYRAPIKRDHKPELYFTIGGQAASKSTSFVVENPSKEGRKEFFVTIPNEGKIGVFSGTIVSSEYPVQEITSTDNNLYPLIKSDFFKNSYTLVDVAVGDLDEDGIAEVVVLLKPGDLVVFKYRKSDVEAMNACYSKCKGNILDANCMSNCWPWYLDIDNKDWKEVQIDGDMIYLLSTGSTGDIFAYRYTPSGLINVSHKDIPDHNYVDFAVNGGHIYLLDNTTNEKKIRSFDLSDLPDSCDESCFYSHVKNTSMTDYRLYGITFGKFNRCNQLFELAVIGAVDHLCLTNETLSCKCCWFSFEQEPNDVELLGENKPAFSSYNSSPILNYIG